MIKIRLTRIGKKKQPIYRIVVAEHTAPIQGKYIEIVGSYNPFTKKIVLQKELVLNWMNKGAKPSNTVAKILLKEGIKHKAIVVKKYAAKSKAQIEKEKKEKEEEKAKEQVQKEEKKAEFEKEQSEKAVEGAEKEKPVNNQAGSSPKENDPAPKIPAETIKS